MIEALLVGTALNAANWLQDQLAACPTSADLEQGIVFVNRLAAYNMIYASKDLGGGVMWRSWKIEGKETRWQSYFAHGLLELRSVRSDGSSLKNVYYSAGLKEEFEVKPQASLSVSSTYSNADRGLSWTSESALRVGELQDVDVAGCTYQGYEVSLNGNWVRSDGESGRSNLRYTYVPVLKYAFWHSALAPSEVDTARRMRSRDGWDVQPFEGAVGDHIRQPSEQ